MKIYVVPDSRVCHMQVDLMVLGYFSSFLFEIAPFVMVSRIKKARFG